MIRFYNGKVLRFSPDIRITDEEVWTDGKVISYVGPIRDDMPVFERQIDLKGDLLMPGFKNAHTHTAMTFLRSMADGMELQSWLKKIVWPREAKLTDDAVYALTKLGIMEYLSSGITASFDMYVHNEAYAKANVDAGFRTVICSGLNNFDADPENIEREYLRFNHYHELVSYMLGIHAEYTTSLDRMEYLSDLAAKYQAPCFTHLCETKEEAEGCIKRYGMSAPLLLDKIGFYRYGGGGFHCCYLTEEDIRYFADHNLWAVTCPASNLKLASGIAPVEQMRKAGVKLAIGTDGASSNNALDMFREMYLVTALQKIYEEDASACPASEVLKMACVNGARAIGLPDCDDISAGKLADITVINLRRPNMRPLNNLTANLVYAGSKENVRLTMVNGKILYENGEFFIGEDPDEIYCAAEEFVRSLEA